jgi:hypothetical protein
MPARSEPAPGSVVAMHSTMSPVAMPGSQRALDEDHRVRVTRFVAADGYRDAA